jgi:hypothetical protein
VADHLHKQIRSAVVTALTGLTTSSTRVYANRLQPLADALSPTLLVTVDEETATPLTFHGSPILERTLDLTVVAHVKAVTALDDTLDLMSKEVEIALAAGITVAGRNLECFYQGMSFDDEQADKPVGVKRLRFRITYTAAANAPDTLS